MLLVLPSFLSKSLYLFFQNAKVPAQELISQRGEFSIQGHREGEARGAGSSSPSQSRGPDARSNAKSRKYSPSDISGSRRPDPKRDTKSSKSPPSKALWCREPDAGLDTKSVTKSRRNSPSRPLGSRGPDAGPAGKPDDTKPRTNRFFRIIWPRKADAGLNTKPDTKSQRADSSRASGSSSPDAGPATKPDTQSQTNPRSRVVWSRGSYVGLDTNPGAESVIYTSPRVLWSRENDTGPDTISDTMLQHDTHSRESLPSVRKCDQDLVAFLASFPSLSRHWARILKKWCNILLLLLLMLNCLIGFDRQYRSGCNFTPPVVIHGQIPYKFSNSLSS